MKRAAPVILILLILSTAAWRVLLAGEDPQPAEAAQVILREAAARVTSVQWADARAVVQENCVVCHRTGGIAPFSLESRADVVRRRDKILSAVSEGRMPPWFADTVGVWENDRSLSHAERITLLSWLQKPDDQLAAAVEPERETIPYEGPDSGEWGIGAPDVVLGFPWRIRLEPEGDIPYQYIYVHTNFPTDVWIQAMQIMPSVPEVVHHALAFIEEPGLPWSEQELGLSGFFAAYGPGHFGVQYPEGQAKRLPRGAVLKFQMHYTPNGEVVRDSTTIGFVFAKEPPVYEVVTVAASDTTFRLWPRLSKQDVSADYVFEEDVLLTGFLPHMHLRGSAFDYRVKFPSGEVRDLLRVHNYDFHWTTEYILKDPVPVPAGSVLTATGRFDNSGRNQHNPNPNAFVRFGDQTYEEMMTGFFHYLVLRDTTDVSHEE
jgi:hypothetical protein